MVYLKKNNLTSLIYNFLDKKNKKRAENHKNDYIDDKVIQFFELRGLICTFLQRLKSLKSFTEWYVKRTQIKFGKRVAKLAIKEKVDAVITYDDCTDACFNLLKKKNSKIKCIMDMSAASRPFMAEIYKRDILVLPNFSKRIMKERPMAWNNKLLDEYKREVFSSDSFLVPSNFVRESLTWMGIDNHRIFNCPYGLDFSLFSRNKCRHLNPMQRVKFIYVGGVKELKGIGYLLESFSKIPQSSASITIVGNVNLKDEDIKAYLDKENILFSGFVLHEEIPKLLAEHDVFIFPSLGDSFSFAALEAAAAGLPLVLSKNTGFAEYITNGVEGFVVETQSIESLVKSINWFINNKNQIPIMGERSRLLSEKFTWSNYNKQLLRAIDLIFMGEENE